jgi:hypothetical protein
MTPSYSRNSNLLYSLSLSKEGSSLLDRPKSFIYTLRPSPIRILSGLRSLCTILFSLNPLKAINNYFIISPIISCASEIASV